MGIKDRILKLDYVQELMAERQRKCSILTVTYKNRNNSLRVSLYGDREEEIRDHIWNLRTYIAIARPIFWCLAVLGIIGGACIAGIVGILVAAILFTVVGIVFLSPRIALWHGWIEEWLGKLRVRPVNIGPRMEWL